MKPNHYIDNKRLYTEMVKYKNAYNEAKENGTETPRVNNYVGKCIKDIAENLSLNRNFIGYSYRQEMIGDGVENCLRYIHNFDPDKTQNPFAYFTQIMWYAFLRRIDKEQKQSYIKYKAAEHSIAMNSVVEMAADDASHFHAVIATMDYDKLKSMSARYETKQKEKKATKKTGIDKFIPDEDNDESSV